MTREQILSLAKQFQQYPDTKEVTLRGESVVAFAEALVSSYRDQIYCLEDEISALHDVLNSQ